MGKLTEDNTCPFCGSTCDLSKGHSCQDSEKDEYYRMRADSRGLNDIEDCIERRKQDEEWGWEPDFKPGTIIKKD